MHGVIFPFAFWPSIERPNSTDFLRTDAVDRFNLSLMVSSDSEAEASSIN
jgi:hypothetical protein